MRLRLLHLYMTLAILLAPVVALAAKEDEETAKLEARLEGFPVNVTLDSGGSVMAWMMVCFLSVVAIACLFKNAKRTHLD